MAGVRGNSCRECWQVLRYDQFSTCQRNARIRKCPNCEKARAAKKGTCAQTDAAKKGACKQVGAARGAQRATACMPVEYTTIEKLADGLEFGSHRTFVAERFDQQVEEEYYYSSPESDSNNCTDDW